MYISAIYVYINFSSNQNAACFFVNFTSVVANTSCFSLISHLLFGQYEGGEKRSSHPEVFLEKGALKICSKFTGEHPCGSAISIKLQSNFIEIALWHGCFPVNLLHFFRKSFLKNTSGWLLLRKEIHYYPV